MSVGRDDLRVRGVNVPQYAVTDFRYDPIARTAVWTLAAPIGADRVLFEPDPARFGPGYSLRLDVLPGDARVDGLVVASDTSAVKRSFFRTTTAPGFGDDANSEYRDLDGSGAILADDFADVERRFFTRVLVGEPSAPPPAARSFAAAAPTRRRPLSRGLLAAAPIPG